jgi:putative FmdB family regulatory protein
MPVYEYRCRQCEKTFEVFTQRQNNPTTPTCPECGKNTEVERVWSTFAGRVGGGCGAVTGGG